MIVGVDGSHFKGNTCVALCATMDASFQKYYSDTQIIKEANQKTQLTYAISSFLKEAIGKFFKKNKALPGGIVIYRQGVSREQKLFLTQEVKNIHELLNGTNDELKMLKESPIPYYYILVNKINSLKFFEITGEKTGNPQYSNPTAGLIVDSISDPSIFEFALQPQAVTQGTANPITYHVAYGNLNIPAVLYELTYKLCYMYSNWQGPVKVPAPLKYAEKLSQMTSKTIRCSLYEKMKVNPVFI